MVEAIEASGAPTSNGYSRNGYGAVPCAPQDVIAQGMALLEHWLKVNREALIEAGAKDYVSMLSGVVGEGRIAIDWLDAEERKRGVLEKLRPKLLHVAGERLVQERMPHE
jgi:hypothetical protein